MSLSLALLPISVADATQGLLTDCLVRTPSYQRPRVARQIRAALDAGLLTEREVQVALIDDRPGIALATLGNCLLRRVKRRCLGQAPTLDSAIRIDPGSNWLVDASARGVVRFWLTHFVAIGVITERQVRASLVDGGHAMLELVATGWRALAERIASEVGRQVGRCFPHPMEIYASPSILDGEVALDRERGPAGVCIETPQPISFDISRLEPYKDDDRLPLLMAGIEAFARRVRCIEVVAPMDVLDGDQMGCEWLSALRYHAAEAVQPDGTVVFSDMLIEQLREEFCIDLDEDDVPREQIENALRLFHDPGVLAVEQIQPTLLVDALSVAGRRGGVLGSVITVVANALRYLDVHALPEDALAFGAEEESVPPAVVLIGTQTGLEDEALHYRFISAMESGIAFSHVVDSDSCPGEVAALVLRELCCISSILSALESFNAEA